MSADRIALVPEAPPAAEAPAPTVGLKFDEHKSRVDLIPPDTLMDVGRAFGFGAKKYAAYNWLLVGGGRRRYYGALLRHVFAWALGETTDPQSGLPHLAHAACCILMLHARELRGIDKPGRPQSDEPG